MNRDEESPGARAACEGDRGGGASCCAATGLGGRRGTRSPVPTARALLDQPFVVGRVSTPAGNVPQVRAEWTMADRWGAAKVRLGVGREHYRVAPGLYALGRPDADSPVLVTANYKLSLDALRRPLAELDAWVLVLDTDGINVWCAAGKGTLGTEELVRRIETSKLAEVVSLRRVILPQLGAPGVAAHEVKQRTGFRVAYGPVRASDVPAYLAARGKATPAMRRVTFRLRDRAVVVPVQLVQTTKSALPAALALFLLGGLGGSAPYWSTAWQHGLPAALAVIAAVVAGALFTPLLLPWLPGRAFALKGVWPSLALGAALAWGARPQLGDWSGRLEVGAWLLLVLALGTFLALNFTGASTYTSLSGVRKEIRVAVPLQLVVAVAALGAWVAARALA